MNVPTHSTRPPGRKALEDEIERLICLLDEIDGDADFEDNGDDEPSIGGVPQIIGGGIVNDLEWDPAEYDSGDRITGGAYHV